MRLHNIDLGFDTSVLQYGHQMKTRSVSYLVLLNGQLLTLLSVFFL